MPIPTPDSFDTDAEPLVSMRLNEQWFSALMGFFEQALDRSQWDATDAEWEGVENAIYDIMSLGTNLTPMAIKMYFSVYTGDDANNRAIIGVGFRPEFLLIWKRGAGPTAGTMFPFMTGRPPLNTSGAVDSLDADGFTVSDDAAAISVNENGVSYQYVTFATI